MSRFPTTVTSLMFDCFLVWTLVIKQFIFVGIIIITLSFSGPRIHMLGSPAPPYNKTETDVFPVYNVGRSATQLAGHEREGQPVIISRASNISVMEGATARMECRVNNLASTHTVSWLRSEDVSVLTVGGLVFSSDPRVMVVSRSRPGMTLGTWSLVISPVTISDTGQYQCQINTDPTQSISIFLIVKFNSSNNLHLTRKVTKLSEESEDRVYTSFTNSKIVSDSLPSLSENVSDFLDKTEIPLQSNIHSAIPTQLSEVTDIPVTKTTPSPVISNNIPNPPRIGSMSIDTPPPFISNNIPNPPSIVSMSRSIDQLGDSGTKFKFTKVNLLMSKHVQSTGVTTNSPQEVNQITTSTISPPEASKTLTSKKETLTSTYNLFDNSLMIPVVVLFCVVVMILTLGSVRGLYSIYNKSDESRPGSGTGTIDSRRSSGSRASLYSTSSSLRKQQQRGRRREREKVQLYRELNTKELKMLPLIEVIESTPVMDSKVRQNISTDLSSSSSMAESDNSSPVSGSYISDLSDKLSERSNHIRRNYKPEKIQFIISEPKLLTNVGGFVVDDQSGANNVSKQSNIPAEKDGLYEDVNRIMDCDKLFDNSIGQKGRDKIFNNGKIPHLKCKLASIESLNGNCLTDNKSLISETNTSQNYIQSTPHLQVPNGRNKAVGGLRVGERGKDRKIRFNPFEQYST